MQSQLQGACFAAALLCCALAQGGEVNCKGMRVKELRQFLGARGVKCEGCAEKVSFHTIVCKAACARHVHAMCAATA